MSLTLLQGSKEKFVPKPHEKRQHRSSIPGLPTQTISTISRRASATTNAISRKLSNAPAEVQTIARVASGVLSPPILPPGPDDIYGDATKNAQRSERQRITKMITSSCITFFLTFIYLWGIISSARFSVFWEICITLLLPPAGFLFGWERWTSKRQRELIALEGMYNLFTIIAKLLILYNGSKGNEVMNFCFVFFFVLQVLGFVKFQVKQKLWPGLIMSLSMATSIAIQRWEMRALGANSQTANLYCNADVLPTLSPEAQAIYAKNCVGGFLGQFLMWGQEAGPMMKLNYLFWLTNVLVVDYAKFLPSLIIPLVHFSSVTIAFFSVEFWHARLITASHLFVLDGIALYKFGVISKDWTTMNPALQPFWMKYVVPTVALIVLILCIICPIISGACGQQSFFCVDLNTGNFTGPETGFTAYRDV